MEHHQVKGLVVEGSCIIEGEILRKGHVIEVLRRLNEMQG
jgi:hypothetical protein